MEKIFAEVELKATNLAFTRKQRLPFGGVSNLVIDTIHPKRTPRFEVNIDAATKEKLEANIFESRPNADLTKEIREALIFSHVEATANFVLKQGYTPNRDRYQEKYEGIFG